MKKMAKRLFELIQDGKIIDVIAEQDITNRNHLFLHVECKQ